MQRSRHCKPTKRETRRCRRKEGISGIERLEKYRRKTRSRNRRLITPLHPTRAYSLVILTASFISSARVLSPPPTTALHGNLIPFPSLSPRPFLDILHPADFFILLIYITPSTCLALSSILIYSHNLPPPSSLPRLLLIFTPIIFPINNNSHLSIFLFSLRRFHRFSVT